MVDINRANGSTPYTGPLPTQNRPTAATVRPAGSTPLSATAPAASPSSEGTGFFGRIGSFFQKAGSTLESWFEPVAREVQNANFQANRGTSQTSASSETQSTPLTQNSDGEMPALNASYNEVAGFARANQNIGYLELERGNVNQKLSQYLTQFKTQIDSNPQLREQLSQTPLGQELLASLDRVAQGKVGTDDVLALQKFAVASGINIGYDGNSSGIDGQFGPKTLSGVQQAFEKLLQDPAAGVQALTAGADMANQGVEDLRRAQNGEIDRYDPNRSESLPDTDAAQPTGPRPTATDFGNSLVASARNVDRSMDNSGKCLKGVRLTLEGAGVQLRDPRTGGNLNSAYQAADVLANQHRDRFTEMTPASRNDLRNLPPGAIVVWDRNPDPGLRAANPSNGYSHGHIEVIGEGGQAYSDGRQSWGVTMNNNGRYGGFRVFLPNS
jgi:hypothetical protein